MPIDPLGWLDDASDALAGQLQDASDWWWSANQAAADAIVNRILSTTADDEEPPTRRTGPPIALLPIPGRLPAPQPTTEPITLRWHQWVTIYDERTCDVCGRLGGTIWPFGTCPFPPPVHDWCRCELLEVRTTVHRSTITDLAPGLPAGWVVITLPYPMKSDQPGTSRHAPRSARRLSPIELIRIAAAKRRRLAQDARRRAGGRNPGPGPRKQV